MSAYASTIRYVFVYGTLMRGFQDDWQAKVGARLTGRGRIPGKLYDLGDYPGAVLSEGEKDFVKGELYYLEDPNLAIRVLDQYEEFLPSQPRNSLFVRKVVPVTTEDGRRRKAWVYFYNRDVDGADFIPDGDYRKRPSPTR